MVLEIGKIGDIESNENLGKVKLKIYKQLSCLRRNIHTRIMVKHQNIQSGQLC
jgi:hypothetical protein